MSGGNFRVCSKESLDFVRLEFKICRSSSALSRVGVLAGMAKASLPPGFHKFTELRLHDFMSS